MSRLAIGLFIFLSVANIALAQTAEDVEARRARLQAELEAEERLIAEQTKLLQAKQAERATVQGEVALLKSQIDGARKRIEAKRVQITRLETDIKRRVAGISELESRVGKEQSSLGELLRKTREHSQSSIMELVLDQGSLSTIFANVDDFELVQDSLQRSMVELRGHQATLAHEKTALEERRADELDAKQTIEYERATIEKRERERAQVLSLVKNQEASYQQILVERQRRAAQIRAALFALRDSAAIPFGQALGYATAAGRVTGVRPAFVLAILQQESNLGANVGSCVITNLRSGETKSLNSGKVFANGIHPVRDLPLLQTLLGELGRNPLTTNVSCPLAVGYGGAMGPAQFIPSTWNLMKAAIADALGTAVPDPWQPRDAFMASALYLRDLGAAGGGYGNEMNAACRYYSGRACSAGVGASYGSQVMARAQNIQVNMIEPLQDA